jgi:Skp family chaperone for outer membrane proteins
MSMKRTLIPGGIGLIVVFLAVWAISAEDAAKPASAGEYARVALLDINKLFKENAAFKKEMTDLKKEADEMDKKMKEQELELRNKAKELGTLSAGSSEYKTMEEDIARLSTDWKLTVQKKRRDFLMRESDIYLQTYQQIETELEKYAREHQFNLVMRFTGDPIDSKNPESVLSSINKQIVWHGESTDITPDLLKIFAEKNKQLEEKKEPKEEKTEPKAEKTE